MYVRFFWKPYFGPMGPPGVLLGPILGPDRGIFSKLDGPGPLRSKGYPHTSFNYGKFSDTYQSFHIGVTKIRKRSAGILIPMINFPCRVHSGTNPPWPRNPDPQTNPQLRQNTWQRRFQGSRSTQPTADIHEPLPRAGLLIKITTTWTKHKVTSIFNRGTYYFFERHIVWTKAKEEGI